MKMIYLHRLAVLATCAVVGASFSFQPAVNYIGVVERSTDRTTTQCTTSSCNRRRCVVFRKVCRTSYYKDDRRKSMDGEDDESKPLLPETSFGSDRVPEAQVPINEYLDIKRQPLFDWADRESGSIGLLVRLTLLYVAVFALVCYPIAGATYTQEGYLVQKVAASNVGALLVVLFLLVRLQSGWGYIGSRLTSKVIEYEDTGWYDGDFEMKTENEQRRDMFLFTNEVKPVIDRVKLFTWTTASLWLASILAFNVAQKPIFDQYNPDVLSQLGYNDKLAEQAASNSRSQPTYCDNRYYRAIANGGQGCK